MPPYDTDSSSDDGEDYTETNVLLGYAAQEATGDAVSHLGGVPTWLDESTTPPGDLAKCKVCNSLLTLLLELNGDLPEHFPGHERRLYLWGCRRKACRRKQGSVRGIRGVRIAKGAVLPGKSPSRTEKKEVKEEKVQPKIGESLFGVTAGSNSNSSANPFSNPFSTNTNGSPPSTNPFGAFSPTVQVTSDEPKDEASTSLPETFASKVKISSPSPPPQPRNHEPWPRQESFPPPYPNYNLDADYETLDAPSTPQIPDNARIDVEGEGGEGSGKEDKEIFESTLDKTFQKFADRISQNPEQVLRYEFKGKPLLYSDSDAVGKSLASHVENAPISNTKVTALGSGAGMPRCQNCGADRIFELQLTPHAITELEAEEIGIDGMEWGTIILGVCSRDCKPSDVAEGDVAYLEEWVGVQWEEVASKK